MNRFLQALAAFFFLFALSGPSWPATGTAPEQDREALRKEAYEKNMEERFRNIGRKLDELTRNADTLAEQARKDMERYLADAEEKRSTAARKLDEMKAESRKKWSGFTRDLNAAMDEFEQAYKRAREHFEE